MEYQQYVNYFSDIAVRHEDIRHTNPGEAFYTADIEELITGIRSKINKGSFVMLLVNYNAKLFRDHKVIDLMFFIVKHADSNNFTVQRAIKSEAELIAQDIIAQISIDAQARTQEARNFFFGSGFAAHDVDVIQTSIRVAADSYYGVQVSMQLKTAYCMKVRPGKIQPPNTGE
jgi:hypothetical protein